MKVTNKIDLNHFYQLFKKLKKELIEKKFETISNYDSSGQKDQVDILHFDRFQILAFKMKSRHLFYLKKIENALAKIENKTFGICEECEKPISIVRLMARPIANECISCKESLERRESHILYDKRSHTLGKKIKNINFDLSRFLKEDVIVEDKLKFKI